MYVNSTANYCTIKVHQRMLDGLREVLVLHNGHTVVETVYVRGPDLQVLVDTVLAPIGAVVVNALSALTRATILVKKGGKPDSTPPPGGEACWGGGGGHDAKGII